MSAIHAPRSSILMTGSAAGVATFSGIREIRVSRKQGRLTSPRGPGVLEVERILLLHGSPATLAFVDDEP